MTELSKMNHTSHNITNLLLSANDDAATSEAYFIAYHHLRTESGDIDMIAAGGYLDRFEGREGRWRFAGRRVVNDWTQRRQASADGDRSPLQEMPTRGRRGPADYVYGL